MFVYRIEFKNYEGDYFTELYHHEENAKAHFEEVRAEVKSKPQFHSYDDDDSYYYGFAFLDTDYNEYFTSITLKRCDYELLFEDRA